jgi:inorganic phosphate transporter, PiT family
MDSALLYLIGLIAVALAFDFLNGLHDAANSIATIVSTRVLRPQYAVFWAAFFNSQKTMGIIAVLLFSHGKLGGEFHVPFWVVLSCQMAMGLGTLVGGWRIVHTMGSKITKLTPMQGFCAETGGAITLFLATGLGIPVSTTHTITGAIIGVGAARRVSAVRWNIAKNIVVAWIITMPMAGVIAAIFYALARSVG